MYKNSVHFRIWTRFWTKNVPLFSENPALARVYYALCANDYQVNLSFIGLE